MVLPKFATGSFTWQFAGESVKTRDEVRANAETDTYT